MDEPTSTRRRNTRWPIASGIRRSRRFRASTSSRPCPPGSALPSGSPTPAWCTLSYLRALNLLPALATPYLLLLLIRRLHPNTSPTDALANAVLLSLAPTHFFYRFLYYTDSLATSRRSRSSRSCCPRAPSGRRRARASRRSRAAARAAVGAHHARRRSRRRGCLALRQTNAVWVAFALGCDLLEELDHSNALPASLPPAAALAAARRAAERGFAAARRCAAGGRSPCCSSPSPPSSSPTAPSSSVTAPITRRRRTWRSCST